MGVSTTADERKYAFREKLRESDIIKKLQDLDEDLKGIIDPTIWGGGEWSEEFRKRVHKDRSKIDNFIEHLIKMQNRY